MNSWCCDSTICRIKAKDLVFLVDDSSEDKKAKGVNKNVVTTISHNEYKNALLTMHEKPYFLFPKVLKRWSFQKNCTGI